MDARIGGLAIVLLGGLWAAPLSAQPKPDVTDAMLECRDISRDNARLQCFDRVLNDSFGKDPEIEEQRAATFGLPTEDSRVDESELAATITEVKTDPKYGTIVFALDNGQVWQTTPIGSLRRLRIGDKATIGEGRLGGYRITIEGRRGFRGVKRVR